MFLWCLHSCAFSIHKYTDTKTQVAQCSAFLTVTSWDLDVGSKNAGCVSSMEGVVACCWNKICDRINLIKEGPPLAHCFRGSGPWALSPCLARTSQWWSPWWRPFFTSLQPGTIRAEQPMLTQGPTSSSWISPPEICGISQDSATSRGPNMSLRLKDIHIRAAQRGVFLDKTKTQMWLFCKGPS